MNTYVLCWRKNTKVFDNKRRTKVKRQVVVYCCIKEHNWSPTTNPETIIMYSNLVYLCSWKYFREAKLLNAKKWYGKYCKNSCMHKIHYYMYYMYYMYYLFCASSVYYICTKVSRCSAIFKILRTFVLK